MTTSERHPRFEAAESLTHDFLTWLPDAPRTYAEAMAAWSTSCPRFSIWEDTLADDLIQIIREPGQPFTRARVQLTPRGRAVLHEHSHG
jgi:hypothetical protein